MARLAEAMRSNTALPAIEPADTSHVVNAAVAAAYAECLGAEIASRETDSNVTRGQLQAARAALAGIQAAHAEAQAQAQEAQAARLAADAESLAARIEAEEMRINDEALREENARVYAEINALRVPPRFRVTTSAAACLLLLQRRLLLAC